MNIMERENLVNQACNLLERYDYDVDWDVVNSIIYTWERNNAVLLEKFRKHPNWDEQRLAIVLDAEYLRTFNKKQVVNYAKYLRREAGKWIANCEITYFNGEKIYDLKRQLNNVNTCMSVLASLKSVGVDVPDDILMETGAKQSELVSIFNQLQWDNGHDSWVRKEDWDKYIRWRHIASIVEDIEEGEHIINQRLKDLISQACDYDAPIGAKTSRVIKKLLSPLGVFEDKTLNDKGKLMCEQEYAQFADAINPLKVIAKTYISLNPIDYWTMSFGHHWSSCHTIDIKNLRYELNGEHTYNGCYSSGTESYMLDSSTFIVYTGKMEDKIKRCNFHVNRDGSVLVQGRVYPDARDDDDTSYAPQFRQIVQNVISECYEVPNNWEVKKGTDNCYNYITENDGKTNYSDYFNYSDCNVSINKGVVDERMPQVYIGAKPICPQCGNTHTRNDNICCTRCTDGVEETTCDHCGAVIDEENDYDYVTTYDDHVYCDEECAQRAGYRYCEDTDDWRDEWYVDSYNDHYYAGTPYIETEDGHTFSCDDNAYEMGYEMAWDDHCWYPIDNLYQHTDDCYYTYPEEQDNTEEEEAVV